MRPAHLALYLQLPCNPMRHLPLSRLTSCYFRCDFRQIEMGEDDAHRSNSHSRLESSGGSSDGCSDGSSDGAAGCSDGAAGCSDGCSDGGSDGGSRPGSLISEARDRDGCSHYRRKARPVVSASVV